MKNVCSTNERMWPAMRSRSTSLLRRGSNEVSSWMTFAAYPRSVIKILKSCL